MASGWHKTYRMIIDQYRQKLREVNPSACRDADMVMEDLGHGWVCDDTPPDVNAILSAPEIAKKHGFTASDIHNWARAGKLTRYGSQTRPKYRLGDVLAYFWKANK